MLFDSEIIETFNSYLLEKNTSHMEDEETVNLNKISFVQPFSCGSTRDWIDHCTKPLNFFYNYM